MQSLYSQPEISQQEEKQKLTAENTTALKTGFAFRKRKNKFFTKEREREIILTLFPN